MPPSRQNLMSKRAVKLCVRRIELLCAGTAAGGLWLASATAPRLTSILTPFAPVFAPLVTPFASVLAAIHSRCLSLCV
jgi:hypothetical protein